MRKVGKRELSNTFWIHANHIISGNDFYKDSPLKLDTPKLKAKRKTFVAKVTRIPEDKSYRLFGRHDHMFELLLRTASNVL